MKSEMCILFWGLSIFLCRKVCITKHLGENEIRTIFILMFIYDNYVAQFVSLFSAILNYWLLLIHTFLMHDINFWWLIYWIDLIVFIRRCILQYCFCIWNKMYLVWKRNGNYTFWYAIICLIEVCIHSVIFIKLIYKCHCQMMFRF